MIPSAKSLLPFSSRGHRVRHGWANRLAGLGLSREQLNERFARLSLRARIAGAMVALIAIAGGVLAAWAHIADDRLKRNITYDLLSQELTHYEHRMRIDRGAEPLRSARLSIYRSADLAELPRHIATLRPGQMHRVRSGGQLLDVLVRDGDFGRLYITYDVTTYARQERIAILVLILGVIAIVAVAGWTAIAISRRLVEPVNALAERLTQIDPRERHVRIGPQFARNELEPIARSVDAFMERLDGFVEREQSFTSTASHELRTPLAVIQGAVELLSEQTRGVPGTARPLTRIQRAVREMSEFSDALLTLSREEAAQDASSDCDVAGMLLRVVEDQKTIGPGKHISLELPAAAQVRVRAPDSMVAMVIGNIVRNALQHGRGNVIGCRLEGRRLTVTNVGGVPEADANKLFQRRFSTRPGGHGMGLYLVRRICERYGWTVQLQSSADTTAATVEFGSG